jgi:hypothetical protein
MIVEPIPPARTWHLILRRKVLASGDLGAVLAAYYKLPAEKRARAVLRCGPLRSKR